MKATFPLSCVQAGKPYRALDKDVALLNVYFGEATVMGRWEVGRVGRDTPQSMRET